MVAGHKPKIIPQPSHNPAAFEMRWFYAKSGALSAAYPDDRSARVNLRARQQREAAVKALRVPRPPVNQSSRWKSLAMLELLASNPSGVA